MDTLIAETLQEESKSLSTAWQANCFCQVKLGLNLYLLSKASALICTVRHRTTYENPPHLTYGGKHGYIYLHRLKVYSGEAIWKLLLIPGHWVPAHADICGKIPHWPCVNIAMISQDNNSSETRLHVRAKLPLTDKSFKHACPQASTAGNAPWHPMVLKPRKKSKLSTWHSLFNVTVLTGLLHGLLFTAFTITRWGHFCWGKNRWISNRTFDHWDETVSASYSFRSRGPHRVSFMSLLGKREDQYDPSLSGRETPIWTA